ncbi:MAG: hypothetical protein ACOCU8_02740 [Patescibacteria group bacterium]
MKITTGDILKYLIITIIFLMLFVLGFLMSGLLTKNGEKQETKKENLFPEGGESVNTQTDTPSFNNISTMEDSDDLNGEDPELEEDDLVSNQIITFKPLLIEDKLSVLYISQTDGHIYLVKNINLIKDNKINNLEKILISNKTFKDIISAYWVINNNQITAILNDKNNSYSLTFSLNDLEEEEEEEIENNNEIEVIKRNLPIKILEVKDLGGQIFVLSNQLREDDQKITNIKGTVGYLVDSDLNDWQTIFISDHKTLTLNPGKQTNNIYIQNKPSNQFPSFLYRVDLDTGVLQKIMGDILGGVFLVNPNGTKVLYNEKTNNSFDLKIFNLKNKNNKNLGFKTLIEKCFWVDESNFYCAAPENIYLNNNYPDVWYIGEIPTEDSLLYKYNLEQESFNTSRYWNNQKNVFNLDIDNQNNILFYQDMMNKNLYLFNILF